MIDIKSLRVDYDNLTAVHDLDLTIASGEIYGLVGPNGAGKTSTIKSIAGVLEPTYGEIKIAGHDLELHPQEALRHLGYMPDFSPVYENLKVWEYLDVFAAAYLIERHERTSRIKYWMNKVDLTVKENELIRNLSRGMRQRLVLAKTLLPEPKVLLLDEPASGMDPIARMDLRKLLKEVAANGASIIISSHILTELSEFCSSIGIMEKGRMVISGTMDEIRERIGSKGKIKLQLASFEPSAREHLERRLFEINIKATATSTNELEFYFGGNPLEAYQILKGLIAEGHPINDFHLTKENVEDIFFKIGAKEVS
jgi:ABC-2 type transport system ATP-binding protein